MPTSPGCPPPGMQGSGYSVGLETKTRKFKSPLGHEAYWATLSQSVSRTLQGTDKMGGETICSYLEEGKIKM